MTPFAVSWYIGWRKNDNIMPFKSNFWNMIISILLPYFWRSNDKLRFILNAITIYSIINYVGFIVIIIGFCILRPMHERPVLLNVVYKTRTEG